MGYKKYRGPVETVEQAMMAHAVLVIACCNCHHHAREYAWKLWNRTQHRPAPMPLGKPVAGFRCKGCRRRVAVKMRVAGEWD